MLPEFRYPAAGVHDCRVVAAEHAPDYRKGIPAPLVREIHRHMTRPDQPPRTAMRDDVAHRYRIISGHGSDDCSDTACRIDLPFFIRSVLLLHRRHSGEFRYGIARLERIRRDGRFWFRHGRSGIGQWNGRDFAQSFLALAMSETLLF